MIGSEVFMDIFSLHRQGHSMRHIAKTLGIHRNTVKKYLQEGKGKPLQYRKNKRNDSILDPFKPIIEDYLSQDQYRATWIYDRLKQIGYTGSYATVKVYVRNIKDQQQRIAYARFETEPAKQAQVDLADFQIQHPNGLITTIYAFIMVLGFSRAMFVELMEKCTLQTFMDAHIHAFSYLGGVAEQILYDNVKHVVIGRNGTQVRFNVEFEHFAHHYPFKPVVCPPYSPWVKGKVERPIDYIRERFWRGYSFDSIQRANIDLRNWLDQVANQRVHGTYHQPVIARWHQEKPLLGKLPARVYDTSIKVFRKVYQDCQISYDTNRYVLPFHVVGKIVVLKIKDNFIRFYYDDQLLATYQQAQGKYQLVGDPRFYDQLRKDQQQLKRKYGRTKGKATRGLTSGTLYPQVMYRPVTEYDQLIPGGASWNS